MPEKEVKFVPPSERKRWLDYVESGGWFAASEYAKAHALLVNTSRKQLERDVKAGKCERQTSKTGAIFYRRLKAAAKETPQ